MDNAFAESLGIKLVVWKPNFCEWSMKVDESHMNTHSTLQGGIAATILDVACGYCGFHPDEHGTNARASTLSLSINYISKARSGDGLVARGKLVGGGAKIFFSDSVLFNAETLETIATATGCFKRFAVRVQ